MQVSALCLLLLHVAQSEVCSDGACGANQFTRFRALDDVETKELDVPQALEMLQMKSQAKVAEGAKDVEEADAEDDASEDEEEEDESEEEGNETVAGDASEDEEEESSEDEELPIGDKKHSGKLCKSCYSTRNMDFTLQKCSDKCSKDSKCKFFSFGHDQCLLCKNCDSKKSDSSYNVYNKWVLKFPVKNGNCKERYSEKSKGKARGCKNDATKNGYSFFAFKNKKCRRWKKCTNTKKVWGWQVNKVR